MTREEILQIAKPVLFNTKMVKAILDGRKTVTRRVVKPANPFRGKEYRQGDGLWIDGYSKADEPNGHIKDYSVSCCWMTKRIYIDKYAPYKPEDILYIRETWTELETVNGCPFYAYKADDEKVGISVHATFKRWHPSIHMPKEGARIFLKVKDVRVERLQKMWTSDVSKEGLMFNKPHTAEEMLLAFLKLWNSTIKKPDLNTYGWDANPYVWVIEFEKMEV